MNAMSSQPNTLKNLTFGNCNSAAWQEPASSTLDTSDTFCHSSTTEQKPITQLDMNLQARRDYDEAQGHLLAVYHHVAARKGENGQEGPLARAQQAWEAFAEAEALQQADSYQGGSIYPLIYLNAKRDVTLERAANLEKQLAQMERS